MKFSTSFKQSNKPKKQRLYRYNAPLHLRGKMLRAHLSDELQKKFKKKNARVIVGDRVKIMKGQFRGKTGKVDRVLTKKQKVIIAGVEMQKKEGTKVQYPIAIPNVMITEFNLDDKKREEIIKRT